MRKRFTMAAAVGLFVVVGQGVSLAQQAYTSTSAPPLIVRLSVVAAPGVPATVALRNGQMGRWSRTDGSQFGLTPVVANGVAQLLIVEITPGTTPGAERVQALATVTLALDKTVAFPKLNPLFEVTLLGTSPVAARPAQASTSDAPCTTCCVTCGEWTVCACAVQMDCGSCCCKEHCTCLGEVGEPAGCAAGSRGGALSTGPAPAVMR